MGLLRRCAGSPRARLRKESAMRSAVSPVWLLARLSNAMLTGARAVTWDQRQQRVTRSGRGDRHGLSRAVNTNLGPIS